MLHNWRRMIVTTCRGTKLSMLFLLPVFCASCVGTAIAGPPIHHIATKWKSKDGKSCPAYTHRCCSCRFLSTTILRCTLTGRWSRPRLTSLLEALGRRDSCIRITLFVAGSFGVTVTFGWRQISRSGIWPLAQTRTNYVISKTPCSESTQRVER